MILPAGIVNASALEEGRSAIRLEETAFAYVKGFKGGRVKGDVKLPARQVGHIVGTHIERKRIAEVDWSLGKGVADAGSNRVFGAGLKIRKRR